MKSSRPAALGFIFMTLLIDVTGLGIVIPVMPDLIRELTGGDLSSAAKYSGWMTTAYAVMQLICAPLLGNLSDRYGRRPVLLISLFGFGIDYLFLAFAPTIAWLFVGRVIAGITGASFTTATAYIADVSTPEKRAQNFGIVGAAFGLGFIIGPVIGGLLGGFGSRVPFIFAACLTLLNWLYGYFVLPESLPKENRRKFEWSRANPIGSLLHMRKYPAIGGLVMSLILVYLGGHALQSTWSFYCMEKFNWQEHQVGISLGVVGAMIALVQGVLIRKTIPKFGQEKSVYIGLIFYTVGMILFAVASQGWMMYAFTVIYCLGGIAGPAIQGLISVQVPSNEQGELQGGLTSLMSATSVVSPAIMTNLFSYFTGSNTPLYLPGAPFYAGAFLIFLSTIFAYRSLRTKKV